MGLTGRLFFVIVSVLLAFSFQAYRRHTKPLPIPKIELNRYWGPGQAKPDNTKIEKFVIDFKKEVRYDCLFGDKKLFLNLIRISRR